MNKEVTDGKLGSAYSAIRRLGAGTETPKKSFDIASFVDKGLSDQQSANLLADHFSKISQEFDPINPAIFPPSIKEELVNGRMEQAGPVLDEVEVFNKITKAKKPKSSVRGDVKVPLVERFAVELAEPVTRIFNCITETLQFPRQWVQEEQTPIPKSYPPLSEDDIRNLSKTAFFSKCYESFIGDWLLPIVNPFLDPGQCGGLKGSSITHYLVKFLHYAHLNLDKSKPHAVLMACVDMSKAFNRTSHQLLIQDLYDMHVPGWLLLIIISYLTERSMILKYKVCSSSRRSLPGSAPQGVFLGNLFFIIKFNGAAMRPPIPRPVWPLLNKYKSDLGSTDPKAIKLKFVDDLSILCNVNLALEVIPDPVIRPRPFNHGDFLLPLLSNIILMNWRLLLIQIS